MQRPFCFTTQKEETAHLGKTARAHEEADYPWPTNGQKSKHAHGPKMPKQVRARASARAAAQLPPLVSFTMKLTNGTVCEKNGFSTSFLGVGLEIFFMAQPSQAPWSAWVGQRLPFVAEAR